MKPTYEQLKLSLSIAVEIIMNNEPGDSRAVSDIAVALAAVDCGLIDDKVLEVLEKYAAKR